MATKQKEAAKNTASQNVKITLTRSLLGRPDKHRRVAKSLGLTRMNQVVDFPLTPTIQGMIKTIPHLITVEYN